MSRAGNALKNRTPVQLSTLTFCQDDANCRRDSMDARKASDRLSLHVVLSLLEESFQGLLTSHVHVRGELMIVPDYLILHGPWLLHVR